MAGNSLVQVKKKVVFLFSERSRREHRIQVRMVTGEFVAMLEYELIARPHDEDTALLPDITVRTALAETLSHGLDAADQRCRSQRFPEAAFQLEGPVRTQVPVHIHLAGEMKLLDKMLRTIRAAASDSDKGNSGSIQSSLDVHEGSSLLPRKHSAEMAKEGKNDASAYPQRLQFNPGSIEILYCYAGDTGL
jgi:hypothetical protein